MEFPLVSVICLCYNQQQFVKEAIESVLQQTYSNIQLIVVDDASADKSAELIRIIKNEHPAIEILLLDKNVGNCKAFNRGLALATGEFVIDLAADDILLPERVTKGVDRLSMLGESYGVHFSDALLINEKGESLQKHSEQILFPAIPQGDVYTEVIQRYFICSPTMLMRKKVLDELGGYDESLHYEDFDFWVRSSRNYLYDYSDEVLVKKRVVKGSLSDVQFNRRSDHWNSTMQVLKKVKRLNTSASEANALRNRLWYEVGYHLKRFNIRPVFSYLLLLF
jgi:glycosyltransferase involved in cell wall biosynthesis